jgi:hypothetical protein
MGKPNGLAWTDGRTALHLHPHTQQARGPRGL